MVNPGTCLVIIVDQVGSTRIPYSERELLEKITINCIHEIKQDFKSFLSGGKTLGDEFEVVLSDPKELYNVMAYVKHLIDTELHIGVGVGEISFDIRDRPSEMYGGVFELARDAMNTAKEQEHRTYIKLENSVLTERVNVITNLIEFILGRLTRKQLTYFYSIKYYHRKNVLHDKVIAHILNVSPPMVSIIKTRSGYNYIERAENSIAGLI
jgi:hypothetical protein